MKIFAIIVLCLVVLSGCSLSVKAIGNVDHQIGQITSNFEKNISLDCRAGLATGLTIAPDTTSAVRATVQALQSVANKDSAEYKKCFGLGPWTSFVIHGVDDVTDKLIQQIITMGLL